MLVLGSGRMAEAIVYDLLKNKYSVTVAGRSKPKWNYKGMKYAKAEIGDKNIFDLMKKNECCISAVPYNFNFELTKLAIKARCNFVDLGGNIEIVKKQFKLNKKAKEKGLRIVPDSGLAPGLVSNLTSLGMQQIKKAEKVQLRVGGLPQKPKGILKYMVVFSVKGLINEYVEPVVILHNYNVKKVNPLIGLEKLRIGGVEYEAFYTSGGTSTLPETFKGKIKTLDYKTIRYPGHAEHIQLLSELELTSSNEEKLGKVKLIPRELLERKIKEKYSYNGKDMVVLQVSVESKSKRVKYELVDKEKAGLSAMMRCTGFPASIIAQMIVRGEIKKKGVLRHEKDIDPKIVFDELKKKGLDIKQKVKTL